LYKNHIATLQERTRDALARFKLDALLIHSGELFKVYSDDDFLYPGQESGFVQHSLHEVVAEIQNLPG
ncbi:YhfX family PLP-dependent enzyme, partial [Escherichia coli]